MNDLVSIIVPVYNVEKYIDKCLKSIISSSYTNIEILLIDDGSTDSSGRICDEYGKLDNRCRVYHKKNGGSSSARNYGLDKSQGKYIMFIDADDWICSDAIETLMKEFAENKDLDCVIFPYVRIFENIRRKVNILGNKKVFLDEISMKKLHRRLFGPIGNELYKADSINDFNPPWGKLYRREMVEKIRFVDVKKIGTAEDLWFNIQAFKNIKKCIYLPNVYYYYNKINETSIVHSYNSNFEKTRNYLYYVMDKMIKEYKYDAEYSVALKNRQVIELLNLARNIINSNLSIGEKYKLQNNVLANAVSSDYFYKFSFNKLNIIWFVYYKACAKQQTWLVILLTSLAERLKKYLR